MKQIEIQKQWEGAAPGWAKWEDKITQWISPATEEMFEMAGVISGAQVLDLASGAGSQTLSAARRVGTNGHVVANDISETMLRHVQENARAAGLDNVSTLLGAAEELDLPPESFDAVICRVALMLFIDPSKTLIKVRDALKRGRKMSVMVFTTPTANAFMAKPMQILLRHAGKKPPAPGQPGIFALGAPGVLERLFTESGFTNFEQRTHSFPMKLKSAMDALQMMQDAFGAYRAVLGDSPQEIRKAAWAEVAEVLKGFESGTGFEAPAEVMVAAGVKSG